MIIADVSGNSVVNATDASMVARYAVQLPVDQIPTIPGGVVTAGGPRANAPQDPGHTPTIYVRPPFTIHDLPTAAPTSTALGFEFPEAVPQRAVDAVMARLEISRAADDEDELPLALEDAVEQLSASQILAPSQ